MRVQSKTAAAASSSTAGAGTGEDHTEGGELVDLDHVLLDERLKVQLNDLKKQDAELTKRKVRAWFRACAHLSPLTYWV